MNTRLKEFFKGKELTEKAFGGRYKKLTGKTVKVLKADLTEAGIEYIDDSGKVCDFHSLRGTFITALDKTDASLKERMALARHSDKGNLTLGTYTDKPKVFDLRRVIEQLPDVWPKQAQVQKATGTDGKPVDADGNFLSNSCFSNDPIRVNTTRCEKKLDKTVEIMPLNVNNEGRLKTSNPKVAGSSPAGRVIVVSLQEIMRALLWLITVSFFV